MTFKIVCPFVIASSHDIQEAGFKGQNTIKLTLPQTFQSPLGYADTTVEIVEASAERYLFNVTSKNLTTHAEQVAFIEQFSDYLTFLLARGEINPYYGMAFVRPTWFDFKAVHVPDGPAGQQEQVSITGALAITSTRQMNFMQQAIPGALHSDLLQFYVDGVRAEHSKSKYFHWFLILECLEHSEKYVALFNSNKLFDEAEVTALKAVADKMDGPKKGAVLSLLSRTKEFRAYKLTFMLQALGITEVKTFQATEKITEDLVKSIIDGRNALFHSGSQISNLVLWKRLFPIATMVIERVSADPACLRPQPEPEKAS